MNIGEYIGESKEKLKVFSSNQYVNAGKEFLQSNSIVAKFAFLILVLLLFMMLLSLGSAILTRIFKSYRFVKFSKNAINTYFLLRAIRLINFSSLFRLRNVKF